MNKLMGIQTNLIVLLILSDCDVTTFARHVIIIYLFFQFNIYLDGLLVICLRIESYFINSLIMLVMLSILSKLIVRCYFTYTIVCAN